jgi:hypothetical protein
MEGRGSLLDTLLNAKNQDMLTVSETYITSTDGKGVSYRPNWDTKILNLVVNIAKSLIRWEKGGFHSFYFKSLFVRNATIPNSACKTVRLCCRSYMSIFSKFKGETTN